MTGVEQIEFLAAWIVIMPIVLLAIMVIGAGYRIWRLLNPKKKED